MSPLVFRRPRPLPTLCQNVGHTGAPRGSPVHVDPLKTPLGVGMRPVGGLRGGLRGSPRFGLEVAV